VTREGDRHAVTCVKSPNRSTYLIVQEFAQFNYIPRLNSFLSNMSTTVASYSSYLSLPSVIRNPRLLLLPWYTQTPRPLLSCNGLFGHSGLLGRCSGGKLISAASCCFLASSAAVAGSFLSHHSEGCAPLVRVRGGG